MYTREFSALKRDDYNDSLSFKLLDYEHNIDKRGCSGRPYHIIT